MSIDDFILTVYFFTFLEVYVNGISYYTSADKSGDKGINSINKCSIESNEYPLEVNCAGNFKTSFSFTTDNKSGRNDFYLLYMVSGKLDVVLGDTTVTATGGNVFIFPPHKRYTYSYSGGEPIDYLWVHFTGSYAERFLTECELYPLPCFKDTGNDQRIAGGFKKLFECFECADRLQKHDLSLRLQQVLLAISRAVITPSEHRSIERSLKYIHAEYAQKISIPKLAAMENLSNSRYIALFNDQMGMSPSAYIIGLRMESAKELLTSTDLSIKQVGILVGYTDPHFFSKLFKRHVGLSPKNYKEIGEKH